MESLGSVSAAIRIVATHFVFTSANVVTTGIATCVALFKEGLKTLKSFDGFSINS